MIRTSTQIEEKEIQDLADEFLHTWHHAQRIQGGSASPLMAPHSLLVFIEDALPPAERKLATQPKGNLLLERYLQSLLQQISVEKRELVEQVTKRRVTSTGVQVDGVAGWVLFIFNFEDHDAR